MLIKLLPAQIPVFWDSIKFACKVADIVEEKDYQSYYNELLHSLLSEKAQCWVRLNEERKLELLLITRILSDKGIDKKYLFLQCLYVFDRVAEEVWSKEFLFIKAFAEVEKCNQISFDSRNPRIWEIAQAVGFKERYRHFVFIGGV